MEGITFSETLTELVAAAEASKMLDGTMDRSTRAILGTLRAGGKVLSCGNGGSATDAQHLVEELVGRYKGDRPSLPGICLCADVSVLTCIGNDYGYDRVFARQVESLAARGDVLVAFTTSGNSPNIVEALRTAKDRGVTAILVTGKDGGKARAHCDIALIVPSDTTARIQEIHTAILHHWLEAVERQTW